MSQEKVNALPQVGAIEAITKGVKNLFNFKGRSRRSEYWWYVLFVAIVITTIGVCWFQRYDSLTMGEIVKEEGTIAQPTLIFVLLMLPSLLLTAIQVRRMHDIERKPILPLASLTISVLYAFSVGLWFYNLLRSVDFGDFLYEDSLLSIIFLLVLVQIIIQIVILIQALKDSQQGRNKYGDSPKFKN